MNKARVGTCVYACVGSAASGVGCQSPTCALFSENPNLQGTNESTCSARAVRGSAAHCGSVPGSHRDFFVSPLESSESFEINLTTVPETDLSMEMHRGERREGGREGARERGGVGWGGRNEVELK